MKRSISKCVYLRRIFAVGVVISTPSLFPQKCKNICGVPVVNCEAISEKDVIESINNELLPVSEAQELKIFRKKSFLSKKDIEDLLQFELENRECFGTTRRDGSGLKRPDSPWHTSYMSTDKLFQKSHQDLLDKLIDVAIEADSMNNWNILTNNKQYFGHNVDEISDTNLKLFNHSSRNDFTGIDAIKSNLRVRVIELHSIERHGSLADIHHCDIGSLVTIDVMLTVPNVDYTGGEFGTLEKDGQLHKHPFDYGDVVVFPSHKYHCVQPVTSGIRKVMVIELWHGRTRDCAHRCLFPFGECTYSTKQSKIEKYVTASLPEVDPW